MHVMTSGRTPLSYGELAYGEMAYGELAYGKLIMANRLWRNGIWQIGTWQNVVFPIFSNLGNPKANLNLNFIDRRRLNILIF